MWTAGAPAPSQPAPVQSAPTAAPAYSPQPAYSQPVVYAPAPASPYGGFWIRFLAYIIDQIILGVVAAPLYFIVIFPRLLPIIEDAERNGEPSPAMIGAIIGAGLTYGCLVLLGVWLYEALLTCSSWQGTIGKKVLRLKVTDEAGNRIGFGRSTGRFFAKILSHFILYIGYIMVGFTDRKRGLHDMIAGTLVMKY
ncbi:MAG TPA: RDD family protein [Candidatus Angelobacter sp.]|nr:RDD family protein [Candidatus Angelobacter sp.]